VLHKTEALAAGHRDKGRRRLRQ